MLTSAPDFSTPDWAPDPYFFSSKITNKVYEVNPNSPCSLVGRVFGEIRQPPDSSSASLIAGVGPRANGNGRGAPLWPGIVASFQKGNEIINFVRWSEFLCSAQHKRAAPVRPPPRGTFFLVCSYIKAWRLKQPKQRDYPSRVVLAASGGSSSRCSFFFLVLRSFVVGEILEVKFLVIAFDS